MLWFIAPPRSPHLLGITPSKSVSECLPFYARLRTDDSHLGISNSANEFLPTHVTKEAYFVVILPANRCQLLHGRFAAPFAKAPLRGKVNRDRQAEFIVRHKMLSSFVFSTPFACLFNDMAQTSPFTHKNALPSYAIVTVGKTAGRWQTDAD